MRLIAVIVLGLAMSAPPLAAGHLYSGGYAPHDERHGAERRAPVTRNYFAAPGSSAAPQRFGLTPWGHTAPRPRTGLDRPYGGHGVPYRTPQQGWPNPPF